MNQVLHAGLVSLVLGAGCGPRHAASDLTVVKLAPGLVVATAQEPPETYTRYDFDVADPPPTARSIEVFRRIAPGMSVADVIRLCGVPDRSLCIGCHRLLYRLDDGSNVEVFASTLCKVERVTHFEHQRRRNTSITSCGSKRLCRPARGCGVD